MHILYAFDNDTFELSNILKARNDALRPLKAQLAWTDGVIAQIVYRLYGLTAEEIAVVEGRG